jgi:hypothetical protein
MWSYYDGRQQESERAKSVGMLRLSEHHLPVMDMAVGVIVDLTVMHVMVDVAMYVVVAMPIGMAVGMAALVVVARRIVPVRWTVMGLAVVVRTRLT